MPGGWEKNNAHARSVQNTMKPVIGITANFSSEDSPVTSLRMNYVDAVTSAGGVPIILPSVGDQEAIRRQIESCNGFIFTGGPDINPARYGKGQHPTISPLSERREDFDFALIRQVIDARKPFLAICLGCQEVNVALGGTLIRDIASETSTTIQHSWKQAPYLKRHDVAIEPRTKLADLVGTNTLSTNSAHHQAVDQPAAAVQVSSRCTDGIIESYEVRNYPFGLGIQWHPEYLIAEAPHLNLFKGLVRAANVKTKEATRRPRPAPAGVGQR
jgi:putative glutamine amidotransferase